jgi:hypothetical protein
VGYMAVATEITFSRYWQLESVRWLRKVEDENGRVTVTCYAIQSRLNWHIKCVMYIYKCATVLKGMKKVLSQD